jgi:hypothetical protein
MYQRLEILKELKLRKCFLAEILPEEDFGIIVRLVMNTDLSHLGVIQGYALAVARDIRINGHQCYLKD